MYDIIESHNDNDDDKMITITIIIAVTITIFILIPPIQEERWWNSEPAGSWHDSLFSSFLKYVFHGFSVSNWCKAVEPAQCNPQVKGTSAATQESRGKKMRSAGLGSFWPSWPSWFQGPTIWGPWQWESNSRSHFWPLPVWSARGWGFTVVCQLLGLSEAMFGYPRSIYHASNICNTTMQKYNQWINQCSRHDVCSYYIQYIIYFIVQ